MRSLALCCALAIALLVRFDEHNRIIREIAHQQGIVLIEGELELPGDGEHFSTLATKGSRARHAGSFEHLRARNASKNSSRARMILDIEPQNCYKLASLFPNQG